MPQPFLDSIAVSGSVQATNGFIGSGAQLTDIPQNATLSGLDTTLTGTVLSSDTILTGIGKLQEQITTGLSGSSYYEFSQSTPTNTWIINHGLNRYPSVTVVDSANNVVIGDVLYNTLNELTVTFGSSFAGKAYLN